MGRPRRPRSSHPAPHRPVPRIPVYHLNVDGSVTQAAEHDLTGSLLDLTTAVLALGEELSAGPLTGMLANRACSRRRPAR